MRRITLVRHAHPDYPVGAHVCLGRTDLPLAPVGRMQGVLLEESLGDCHFTAVFLYFLTEERISMSRRKSVFSASC